MLTELSCTGNSAKDELSVAQNAHFCLSVCCGIRNTPRIARKGGTQRVGHSWGGSGSFGMGDFGEGIPLRLQQTGMQTWKTCPWSLLFPAKASASDRCAKTSQQCAPNHFQMFSRLEQSCHGAALTLGSVPSKPAAFAVPANSCWEEDAPEGKRGITLLPCSSGNAAFHSISFHFILFYFI